MCVLKISPPELCCISLPRMCADCAPLRSRPASLPVEAGAVSHAASAPAIVGALSAAPEHALIQQIQHKMCKHGCHDNGHMHHVPVLASSSAHSPDLTRASSSCTDASSSSSVSCSIAACCDSACTTSSSVRRARLTLQLQLSMSCEAL